jgi:riboflavin kinase/FMN adenylyltransferase
MKTIYLNDLQQASLPPTAATIGFFDGVHRGHRYLIDHVRQVARERGLVSTVITFDRHPRQVLQQGYQPQLLTTLSQRLLLLSKTGIDQTVVLPFSREMAQLSALQFMDTLLSHRLNVRALVIGYDNRFGHNRAEGFDDYVSYGQQLGIDVIHNPAFTIDGIQVSSSVVRSLIIEGEISLANQCLGYPYTLEGRITDGFHEGRRLGYPTANLDPKTVHQLVPARGVYATLARPNHTMTMRPAMTNIGLRPTFGGTRESIETNIFNFQEDLYGQQLHLSFIDRIRNEQRFENVTSLVEQLKEDEKKVKQLFQKRYDRE